MRELFTNIYIGSDIDYNAIKGQTEWAVLHCCKHPYHCQFVGYKGNLPAAHPDYALKRIDNEMALNLVDMDKFDSQYLGFNRNMFQRAFEFLDEYRTRGYKLLIHCNQGESRAPTLGMLYVAYLGLWGKIDFASAVNRLEQIYPSYSPRNNIFHTVENLWYVFVK